MRYGTGSSYLQERYSLSATRDRVYHCSLRWSRLDFHEIRYIIFSTLIESLMIFAASYLIGRLIHAEAIPGIRQFWITRPYRWRSLLMAKLLFIFAFVNIPVLLAQLVIPLIAGFSLHAILPGLLWRQFLLFAGVALPVAAVASLTPGTVAFIFTGAILLAIGLNISTVLAGVGLLWFGTVEWVRDSVVVGAIIAFAVAIVYWQYSKRSTRISRLTGLAGLAVAISCYAAIPWTSAFRVQAGLAKGSVDLSGVSVSLDSKSKGPVRWARKFFKEVDLPLRVAGIPPGIDLQVENIAVTLRSPSGAVWKSNAQDGTGFTLTANEGESEVTAHSPILVDEKFFEANRKRAVKLELAVYLTALGDKLSKNISISEGRTEVMPGLHCGQGTGEHRRLHRGIPVARSYRRSIDGRRPRAGLDPLHLILAVSSRDDAEPASDPIRSGVRRRNQPRPARCHHYRQGTASARPPRFSIRRLLDGTIRLHRATLGL